MSEKRALIVDDSKSARVVLSRMLQKYDLAVDTSDSAEQALEYLKAHRPDVIFMDHLMPGMDGLEAVQAIRSNPETAAIPIMMYTSQEGDLYLGQARASGATGVLPKKIGSTEVSKILQELQLVGGVPAAAASDGAGPIVVTPPHDGTTPSIETAATVALGASGDVSGAGAPATTSSGSSSADTSPHTPANASASADAAGAAPLAGPTAAASNGAAVALLTADDLRLQLEPLLKQHSADLRRFVVASLDSFAARVTAETRELIRTIPAPVAPAPVVVAPTPEPPAPPEPAPRPVAWMAIAAVAAVAALAAAGYGWQQRGRIGELEAKLAAVPAAAAPAPAPAAVETAPAVPPLATAPFGYGEPPLSGARIEKLANVLEDLERQRVHGTVLVTVHTGDFCLTGNPAEGYVLAPADMTADRCDQVGNPAYDALTSAQRDSSQQYAEVVAATRARTNGALDARVVEAPRRIVSTPYPGEGATAEQWNAAAAANQRVDFVLEAPAAQGP